MISRMSLMEVLEAASISITSTWRDSMMSRQCRPGTERSRLGPPPPSMGS